MERVSEAHGVPLPAVALAFSKLHPVVASVVTGFGSGREAEQTIQWIDDGDDIPDALWSDMKAEGLIHPDMPTGDADAYPRTSPS